MRRLHLAALAVATLAGCGESPDDSPATRAPACPDPSPWVAVAARDAMSCGLHADGCFECWGPILAPVWESDQPYFDVGISRPPDVRFDDIWLERTAENPDYACGRRAADGAISCWGWAPREGLVGPVEEVQGSSGTVCGRYADGRVACVGYWEFDAETPVHDLAWEGEGVATIDLAGTLAWKGSWDAPPEELGSGYAEVALGGGRDPVVCAAREGEGPTCVAPEGDTDHGAVVTDAPETPLTHLCVSRGGDAACGLDASGYPFCWGAQGWTPPSEALSTLSCGGGHACGVTLGGDVACWGTCDDGVCTPPDPG